MRKYCLKHGLYEPGNPPIPGGRCPECRREHNNRDWRTRRKIRSGWEWGRLRDQVHRRDRVCVVCGATSNLVVHHRIPLRDGGTSRLDNLELRCETHHTHAPLQSRRKPRDATTPFF
jgi:5-methylcytosine-specific restriction endonuclease McrA